MNDFLMSSFGNANPLFGGQAEPPNVLDFNALAGNPLSGLLGMIGNRGIAGLFNSGGAMPGQFFPTQNIYDQMAAKQYHEARERAMAVAGVGDRETYVRMLRGAARMTGQPFGIQQERAARTIGSGLSSVAPMIQGFIGADNFDALHGSRGSASVMAQFLHRGGRQAIDPITGMTGLSGESAGAFAAQIHRTYFGDGNDLSDFKGMSAGRTGMLFDELQSRGLVGGGIGSMDEGSQMQALARGPGLGRAIDRLRREKPHEAALILDQAGLGGMPQGDQDRRLAASTDTARKAVDAIKANLPGELDNLKRDFDFERYAGRLKNLAGAVAGVRDIFGDAGRPNAPMREIIEGLEHLTQGGLATQSAGHLEKSLRTTQALADMTGMGLNNTMGLMARGAGLADRMGLDRSLAVGSTQGSMAFGAAFGQGDQVNTPHAQARSRDEMTVLDQNLRMNAARSGLANQLATGVRLVTSREEQGLEVGGRARAFAAAVRANRSTFDDLETGERGISVFQTEDQFNAMMTGGPAGFRREDVARAARQGHTNQATINEFGIQNLVRDRAQGDEIATAYANAQHSGIADLIQGKAGARTNAVAAQASRAMAEAIQRGYYIDAAGNRVEIDRRNNMKRNAVMADILGDSLKAQEVVGIDRASLIGQAESGFAAFDQATRDDPARRFNGTGLASLEAQDEKTLALKTRIDQEARTSGLIRSSLAGLGQAGPLSRISDAIQMGSAGAGDFLAKVMGGISPREIKAKLDAAGSLSDQELAAHNVTSRDRVQVMSQALADAARTAQDARGIRDDGARNAVVSGATADIEALTTGGARAGARIDQILGAGGFGAHQIGDVLSGKIGSFSEADLARLRALRLAQSKDLLGTARDAEMAVGATTGAADTREVLSASDRLTASYNAGDRAKAREAADAMAKRSNDVSEGLVVDPASLEALGAGGLGVAKGLREKQLALAAMAGQKGMTTGALLASNDPDSKDLRLGIHADMVEIRRRQEAAPGTIDRMGQAEKDEAAKYRDETVAGDPEQNRRSVDRLLKATGGERLTEAQRQALAAQMGTGRNASVARFELGKQLEAREELDALAKDQGWDPSEVRKAIAEGKAGGYANKLTGAARRDFDKYSKEAGRTLRLGDQAGEEGVSNYAYGRVIDGLKPREVAAPGVAASAAAGTPTRITGTLEIKGNVGTLNARNDAGAGSTPVAINT